MRIVSSPEMAQTAPLRGALPQPSRTTSYAILLGVLLGHTALTFHALSAKTFWFDEGMSVGIARLDFHNFLRILWRREGNMSLYYLALRGWIHLGSSPAFVRSLSVLPCAKS